MSHSIITGPHGLYAEQCECGRPKVNGCSFCRACYKRLPPAMKTALYKRVGQGYEEAHLAARNFFLRNGIYKRPAPITFGLDDTKGNS